MMSELHNHIHQRDYDPKTGKTVCAKCRAIEQRDPMKGPQPGDRWKTLGQIAYKAKHGSLIAWEDILPESRRIYELMAAAVAEEAIRRDRVARTVAAINNATPEQQAAAMLIAGPDGEAWGRMFEDGKGGHP